MTVTEIAPGAAPELAEDGAEVPAPTDPAGAGALPAKGALLGEDLVEEELLVEEISIDGMCGVY